MSELSASPAKSQLETAKINTRVDESSARGNTDSAMRLEVEVLGVEIE